jgi:hypothetical protein
MHTYITLLSYYYYYGNGIMHDIGSIIVYGTAIIKWKNELRPNTKYITHKATIVCIHIFYCLWKNTICKNRICLTSKGNINNACNVHCYMYTAANLIEVFI